MRYLSVCSGIKVATAQLWAKIKKLFVKDRDAQIARLKKKMNKRLARAVKVKEKARARARRKFREPRYDDVFFEGFKPFEDEEMK